MKLNKKYIWDYNIKDLDLSQKEVLIWYLQRKIQYGDWESIDKKNLRKYFEKIKVEPELKKILKGFLHPIRN